MSFNIDVFRRVFFKALNVLKIPLFLAKNVGAEIQEIYAIQGKDTLLKDRQRRLVSIQPMSVQISGLQHTVIISLLE